MSKQEATRLADALTSVVQTYPQMSEDEPGGYCSEVDQIMDEAAALLRRWPDGEPAAPAPDGRVMVPKAPTVEMARDQSERIAALEAENAKLPCGHHASMMLMSAETGNPLYCEACDDKTGRRDAELVADEQRTRIAALETERSALRTALEFASAAVEDAIYTEDGIDGQDGERLLYIFREALERGTFDKVRYGDLPPMLLEVRNNALEAALEQARVALESIKRDHWTHWSAADVELVNAALRAIEEMRK